MKKMNSLNFLARNPRFVAVEFHWTFDCFHPTHRKTASWSLLACETIKFFLSTFHSTTSDGFIDETFFTLLCVSSYCTWWCHCSLHNRRMRAKEVVNIIPKGFRLTEICGSSFTESLTISLMQVNEILENFPTQKTILLMLQSFPGQAESFSYRTSNHAHLWAWKLLLKIWR